MFSNPIGLMWLFWVVYWCYAARGARKTVTRESRFGRMTHLTLFVLAIVLLNSGILPDEFLNYPVFPAGDLDHWVGCAVTAFGLGWAIWARVHLGSYWSGEITLKEGHKIIQSGPYAYSRHPIYTGLLIAVFGSAIDQGEIRGLFAVALILLAILRKSSIEESLLMSHFPQDYANYRSRVKRLIPGLF